MNSPARLLRVVLAEDSPLLRTGLAAVLTSAGHEMCACVADAPALLHAWDAYRPDLVVTDVRMPPGNADDGLRAAAALRKRAPELPVVVLSQYVSVAYLDELLDDESARGGVGYLLKERVGHVRQFLDAVDRVAGGETIIDPDVVRALVKVTRSRGPLATLTPREREVLGLIAEGHTNAGIARRLTVSEAAVRKHVGAIFAKLPLHDGDRRVQAALLYLRSLG